MALRFQANHGLPFNGGIRSISATMIDGPRAGFAMWKQSYGPRPAPPIFPPKYDPGNSRKTALKSRLSTACEQISNYLIRPKFETGPAFKPPKTRVPAHISPLPVFFVALHQSGQPENIESSNEKIPADLGFFVKGLGFS